MRVNGRVAIIGDRADAGTDEITVDNRPVRAPLEHAYIALNKPAGFACTRHDPYLPRTVYDLLPPDMDRLFTVGRLDVDTEGLLLMTTDGAWANDIAHPRKHVDKAYRAEVGGFLQRAAMDALRDGVDLDDGRTLPARVRVLEADPYGRDSLLEITITEGRKRQVRRMLAAVNLEVLRLERVSVGSVRLRDLPTGRWRYLWPDEIAALRREGHG